MKSLITAAAALLVLSPMAMAGMIVSLQNQMPEGKGWRDGGTLPGQLVEEGSKRVLQLKDDSESGQNLYFFEISERDAAVIKKNGFELNFRVNVVESGAHTITLRIKDAGVAMFSFWRDEKAKNLQVSSWDYEGGQFVSGRVNGLHKYVDVKAVWDPAKSLEVFLDGKAAYTLGFRASDRIPHNALEIGVADPRRKGVLRIESLSLIAR